MLPPAPVPRSHPICHRCGEPGVHGGDGDECIEALRRAVYKLRGSLPHGKTTRAPVTPPTRQRNINPAHVDSFGQFIRRAERDAAEGEAFESFLCDYSGT